LGHLRTQAARRRLRASGWKSERASALLDAGFAVVPAGLTVFLAWHAGGFFPGATATAALIALLLCAAVVAVYTGLRAGITWRIAAVGGGLGLLCVWVMLSALWSNAPGRALLEFDRALLYLAVVLAFAIPRYSARRLRWMVRAVAGALLIVCLAALTTRLAADVWPTVPVDPGANRLSYPLTYWNGLGLIAGLGAVLCFYLASADREPGWVRVAGAVAVPPMVATVVLTFSRGAIVAGALGLATYLVAARPRLALTGLAVVPSAVVAVVVTLGAQLVASAHYKAPAAISEGHHTALVLALCAAGAGVLRAALLVVDRWILRLPRWSPGRVPAALGGIALVGAVIALGAHFQVPERLDTQVHRFVQGTSEPPSAQVRRRLTDPGNPARVRQWTVAIDGFKTAPLIGHGAGTYQLQWERHRIVDFDVIDAHSLYLETLSEFGLVGAILLIVFLGGLVVALGSRCRGPNRAVFGAILAITVAWLVHAGLDWDWESPATTLWVLALASTGVGSRGLEPEGVRTALWLRLGLCALVVLIATIPVRVGLSQLRLDQSLTARIRGDCTRSIALARQSISALDKRSEPYEALGYCSSRRGEHRAAVAALDAAVDRDPESWSPRYGLALVRASAGLDPRPALAAARRRNPLGRLAGELDHQLRHAPKAAWTRIARRSQLPPP
jgi:O-Antigen ligase